MDMQPYIVYVRADEAGRITAINSSAFLPDTTDWVRIDGGYGDKYHHAQGNYLDKPLYDKRCICRYKLVDGAVQERTQEEMDADYNTARPAPPPTDKERITALEEENAVLLECLLEMSEIVYA